MKQTRSKQVMFSRPFMLSAFDSPQPAGAYTVDTEEKLVEKIAFPVWMRVATVMRLKQGGSTKYLPIDPNELHEALMRDAALSDLSALTFVPPVSHSKDALDVMNAFLAQGRMSLECNAGDGPAVTFDAPSAILPDQHERPTALLGKRRAVVRAVPNGGKGEKGGIAV